MHICINIHHIKSYGKTNKHIRYRTLYSIMLEKCSSQFNENFLKLIEKEQKLIENFLKPFNVKDLSYHINYVIERCTLTKLMTSSFVKSLVYFTYHEMMIEESIKRNPHKQN